jgi:hypothetical protein
MADPGSHSVLRELQAFARVLQLPGKIKKTKKQPDSQGYEVHVGWLTVRAVKEGGVGKGKFVTLSMFIA